MSPREALERLREVVLQRLMGDGYDRGDLMSFALGSPSTTEGDVLSVLLAMGEER